MDFIQLLFRSPSTKTQSYLLYLCKDLRQYQIHKSKNLRYHLRECIHEKCTYEYDMNFFHCIYKWFLFDQKFYTTFAYMHETYCLLTILLIYIYFDNTEVVLNLCIESKYILPMFCFFNLCSDIIATLQFVISRGDKRQSWRHSSSDGNSYHESYKKVKSIQDYIHHCQCERSGNVVLSTNNVDTQLSLALYCHVQRRSHIALNSGVRSTIFCILVRFPARSWHLLSGLHTSQEHSVFQRELGFWILVSVSWFFYSGYNFEYPNPLILDLYRKGRKVKSCCFSPRISLFLVNFLFT